MSFCRTHKRCRPFVQSNLIWNPELEKLIVSPTCTRVTYEQNNEVLLHHSSFSFPQTLHLSSYWTPKNQTSIMYSWCRVEVDVRIYLPLCQGFLIWRNKVIGLPDALLRRVIWTSSSVLNCFTVCMTQHKVSDVCETHNGWSMHICQYWVDYSKDDKWMTNLKPYHLF